MKSFRARVEESGFDLNLAPMLDIIVSIIPMLLMSVVFVQITVIETPVPQAVEKAMAVNEQKNEVQIQLSVSKASGIRISVTDKGQNKEQTIALKDNALDLPELRKQIFALKQQYPNHFRVELNPDETLQLNEIVQIMDHVRNKAKEDPKIKFTDVDTGKLIETDLMFPDVVFGNVAGG
jgi:biopolymer transport protein ExbD